MLNLVKYKLFINDENFTEQLIRRMSIKAYCYATNRMLVFCIQGRSFSF